MFVLPHFPFHGFLQDSAILRAPFHDLRCVCEILADLRSLGKQHPIELGEFGESEISLFESLPSPSVVGALAPAVETSFHGAASALSIVERSGSGSSAWALGQSSDVSGQGMTQQANKLLANSKT